MGETMRRHVARLWLAAALAGACLPGCWGAAHYTYPADPLFASRRPIEAQAETGPPAAVAYSEPAVPPVPGIVLAIAQHDMVPPPVLPARRADRPDASVVVQPAPDW
jgi:hypothetical protein